MKKTLLSSILLVGFLAVPKLAFAAITATTVWELRDSATGGNLNGGGFDSSFGGTDYTQQDTAVLTLTDLAQTAGTTTLTSATGGFTAAMVGNVMRIHSGTNFTAGWYQITAYTDTNTVTIDRTAAPSLDGSSGTGRVGGAMSLNSTLDDDFFDVVVAGNTVWIKSGSYSLGESVIVTTVGTVTSPIIVEGYNTTRGDTPTGANRPTIAHGNNYFQTTSASSYWNIRHLITTGISASGVFYFDGSNHIMFNTKITNNSTTAGRVGIYTPGIDKLILNSEVISYRGDAISMQGSHSLLYSYIHDSNRGVIIASSLVREIIGNIIESNVTAAIQATTAVTGRTSIIHNTLYGSEAKTGTGMILITGSTDIVFMNNIIYGFVTGISHADANQKASYDDYNAYYNNTANATNWTLGANSQTTLDPGFTSVAQVTGTTATYAGTTLTDAGKFGSVVAGRDYIYIISGTGMTAGIYGITSATSDTVVTDIDAGENAAGNVNYQITTGRNFAIGTNLKALGFPGAFQAGLTTGYMDIGAVQRQEAGGGGSSGGIRGRIKIR